MIWFTIARSNLSCDAHALRHRVQVTQRVQVANAVCGAKRVAIRAHAALLGKVSICSLRRSHRGHPLYRRDAGDVEARGFGYERLQEREVDILRHWAARSGLSVAQGL